MKRGVVLVVALLLALPAVAGAYLSALSGSGAITATADVMPAGAQPATSVLGRNVLLRWAPSRFSDPTVAMSSYTAVGSHPTAAGVAHVCAPVAEDGDGLLACEVIDLEPGDWAFSMVPRFASWEGAASEAAPVVVPMATLAASPSTATDGDSVVVRTTGFLRNQVVELHWNGAAGEVLGSLVTAHDGTGEATVVVPLGTSRGSYPLVAVGSRGDQSSMVVTVANRARNSSPIATDDDPWVTGTSDLAVLANDGDPDGDPLVVVSAGRPRNGRTLVVNGGAAVRYLPTTGFRGEDTFTYDVSDGQGGTARATVRVTVGRQLVSGWLTLPTGNVRSLGGAGATATSEEPISVRWTSPVAGPFRMLLVGPQPKTATGWVVGGHNVRISGPAATAASQPHTMLFRVEAPAVSGKKARPATTEVFLHGREVPPCAGGFGVATPSPCVARNLYEAETNDYVVLVWAMATE